MKRCIAIIGILGSLLPLYGDDYPFAGITGVDSLHIGVQDALFLALERNASVTIQWRDQRIAETRANLQRAAFDPVLSAGANRSESKSQRFLGSRPEPFELTTVRKQYDAQLSQTLPTGSTLALVSSFYETNSSIYLDQYVGTMGVTFSQALLQGAGFGANLAALRRARLDVEISRSEMKGVAERVVADVEVAYWGLYLAKREIEIQQESLSLAEQQLQESLERVAVGKLPTLELAAVHAEVSARQEALIEAQSRYEQARLHFIYLLNPARTDIWAIKPVLLNEPVIPEEILGEIELHQALGIQYRPDLQQAGLALKKGELEIARTRNGLLPKLDLFVSLGRTSYAQTFKEGLPDYSSPFYDVSGGLSFTFPLPNRAARAQAAEARWSREQMQLSFDNMKRMVEWDVRAAYIEVLRTLKLIETTKVTLSLQEKKLDAELEKFRVGRSTNYLVLQAQRDFTSSQLDAARSIVAYLDALIRLYQMQGTLLERRGIVNLAE